MLSRSLGRELIVSVDRLSMPLVKNDRLLLCSDGLYNVFEEREIEHLLRSGDAAATCKALIEAANARGTADNLTAAVFIMNGATPFAESAAGAGWREWLGRLFATAALSRAMARRGARARSARCGAPLRAVLTSARMRCGGRLCQ